MCDVTFFAIFTYTIIMGELSIFWQVVLLSGISIYVGSLAALITWGAWLQPWLDKRKYIVYTVDISQRHDGESMDDFMVRVRDEGLGKYDVIG